LLLSGSEKFIEVTNMSRALKLADPAFLARAVANAITPNSFANLLHWWKADSYSLADNTTIGGAGKEWLDQKDSNDATTGTGSVAYRTAGIGGVFPSLEFANESLNITAFTLAGDFTIIVVAESTADDTWLGHNSGNAQIRRRRSGTNNASFYSGSGSEVISDTFGTTAGNIVMTTWRRSGSTVSIRENKTARNSGTNSGSTTINRIGSGAFTTTANGDLGELTVYTSNLSDANVDQLYDEYFKARWGLP
jgi:hypothetical protein